MAEDSTDAEFAKTVKELHEAAKKVGSIGDIMNKMMKDSITPLKEAAEKLRDLPDAMEKSLKEGLGSKGGRAVTPGGPAKPSEVEHGFLKRRWDASKLGRAYKASSEGYTRYFYGNNAVGGKGGPGGPGVGAKPPGGPPGVPGGAGGGGIGAGAKAAGVVGVAITAAMALNDFRKAVQQASAEALRSAQKYAEVNGAMAKVFADKEVRDIRRDQQIGERTAGSTGKLAEAASRRENATAPFEAVITNATNNILSFFENKIADFLEQFRVWINGIISKLPGGPAEFFPKLAEGGADAFGFDATMLQGAKLDGRRLADIAAATVARVRGGLSAPANAAALGKLP